MDSEVSCFVRHYKYKEKINDGFTTKYILTGDIKEPSSHSPAKKEAKGAESKPEEIKPKIVEKASEVREKKAHRQTEKTKEEKEEEQLYELRKYNNKVNMKKHRKKREEDQPQSSSSEEELPKKVKKRYYKMLKGDNMEEDKGKGFIKSKAGKKQKEKPKKVLYDEYLDKKLIDRSRTKGENIYFRGRVEFGEGPKHRGKINSEEVEGLLLVEGRNRNRCLHDDLVYFVVSEEQKERTMCRVVYVEQEGRQVVGRVDKLPHTNKYILRPISSRIADLNIEKESVPEDVQAKMGTHYYSAELKGWTIYSEYPTCRLIKPFGKFGEIEIETSALLKTQNVEDKDYDPVVAREQLKKFMDRLDENEEYAIPEEQIAKREDLRQARIFTIDPLNARDFDDALSITPKEDGWQVGVHIADASYFVEEGSPIDQEAQQRTTSVYLVHRVIPMLPRILCQNLCSLNPGKERLTFTLWIRFDRDGRVRGKPRASKSVIKSKARFTYEQAQRIIEGTAKTQKDIQEGFGCVDSEVFAEIARDVEILNRVSTLLRQRRVERGSLFFQVPKKVFKLGDDTLPQSFSIYERKEAHFLVEEMMIIANQQVGTLLVDHLGGSALLRRHKFPGPKKIARFQHFMNKIGEPLQLTKQTRVQEQVNAVLSREDLKQSARDIIKYQMIGLLEAADYFLVGDSQEETWVHYALNAPIYTHFTSPIRRYPDILVHRLLASTLQGQAPVNPPKKLVELCNEKKLQAKRVSSGCQKVFLCLYLKSNAVIGKGIIQEVEEWGLRVCLPRFDFKGMLRFKEIYALKVVGAEDDPRGRRILRLEYEYGGENPSKFILKELQEIEVQLTCRQGFPLDYRLTLMMPHPKKLGEKLAIV